MAQRRKIDFTQILKVAPKLLIMKKRSIILTPEIHVSFDTIDTCSNTLDTRRNDFNDCPNATMTPSALLRRGSLQINRNIEGRLFTRFKRSESMIGQLGFLLAIEKQRIIRPTGNGETI
jgi:hypothetical protein